MTRAVFIRDGRVAKLLPLEQYELNGTPLVNDRGFEIRVDSQKDLNEFLTASREQKEGEQFGRWLRFETYRSITFRCDPDANYVI